MGLASTIAATRLGPFTGLRAMVPDTLDTMRVHLLSAGTAFPEKTHVRSEQTKDESGVDSEEQTLISASSSGDGGSFAKLVNRYEGKVASLLWRFTRDPLVLNELVQDTFVEAYFSLRRFRAGSPFFPWLKTVATRVGYRYWRRTSREMDRRAILAGLCREAPRMRKPEGASDDAEYVHHVLQLLQPKDRLVLTLQYLEGCSVREIAERTGWTQSLTKVRAFRARNRLKALLTKLEDGGDEKT